MTSPAQAARQALATEVLVEKAIEITGLDDFGQYSFEQPLAKLVECMIAHNEFTEDGLVCMQQDLVRCLVNRLRMQRDINEHPEILEEDVSDPIIVLGLGRSGTTKMHKMLSEPDNIQKTTFWRIWNPAPFPNAVAGEPDPRIAAAGTADLVATDNATVKAAHNMDEQEVEEEWLLYTLTFDDWIWCALMFLPSYFDWTMARPSQPVYDYVKTILQYLQWQDGGKQGRRWVLKSVGYLADMDALNHCYANATYLHTHRDPRDTIPSWAKFASALWTYKAKPVAPEQVGQEMLRSWSTAINRYLEARQRLALDERILDVAYEQVRQDPMGVIRQLYQRANLPLAKEAEDKMAAWHKTNEQFKHGKHEYSLSEFGLSEAQIDNAFSAYIDRFIAR
jgi:hypothetical protein